MITLTWQVWSLNKTKQGKLLAHNKYSVFMTPNEAPTDSGTRSPTRYLLPDMDTPDSPLHPIIFLFPQTESQTALILGKQS